MNKENFTYTIIIRTSTIVHIRTINVDIIILLRCSTHTRFFLHQIDSSEREVKVDTTFVSLSMVAL